MAFAFCDAAAFGDPAFIGDLRTGEDGNPLFNGDAASCIEYLQTEVLPLPFPVPLETAAPLASTIPPPSVAQSASARPPPPSVIQPSSAMRPPHHSDPALLAAATFSGKVYMIFLGEVFLGEASWREASSA